jgi:prophage regulatory protein
MTPQPAVYLSAADLAARYGVHITTIWRWAKSGRLPRPVRVTEWTTRWRKEDVDTWEAARLAEQDAS